MQTATTTQITLTQAAAKAGVRYKSMLDYVLRGVVRGWQDETRHWRVDGSDLDRFIREQRKTGKQAA